MSEQNVQVTQVDRDAAADLHVALSSGMVTNAAQCAEAIRNGLNDHWEIVAAFARHRTRAEPDLVEAAKKASNISINKGREIVIWFEDACPEAFDVFNFFRAALTRADV